MYFYKCTDAYTCILGGELISVDNHIIRLSPRKGNYLFYIKYHHRSHIKIISSRQKTRAFSQKKFPASEALLTAYFITQIFTQCLSQSPRQSLLLTSIELPQTTILNDKNYKNGNNVYGFDDDG